jgi:hypothetical protein
MKLTVSPLLLLVLLSCQPKVENEKTDSKITFKDELMGSWELISTLQIKPDTTISTKTPGHKMIKIINQSHFAFLQHALKKEGDSSKTATPNTFVAGGGTYSLNNKEYTEHLEFCNYPEYEGNDFAFKLEIRGDTLIQSGEEKLKDLGIGEQNVKLIETYVRIKDK